LKESLQLRAAKIFFGVFENKTYYEAYFRKTREGCFKVEGVLSGVIVDVFKTYTMTFCEPPGTVIRFDAVREGREEPEIARFALYYKQKTEMWFRPSEFMPYGEISFKEVGRETTLSSEVKALPGAILLMIGLGLAVRSIFLNWVICGSGDVGKRRGRRDTPRKERKKRGPRTPWNRPQPIFSKRKPCPHCDFTSNSGGNGKCSACHGFGGECRRCHGSGICPTCRGSGWVYILIPWID